MVAIEYLDYTYVILYPYSEFLKEFIEKISDFCIHVNYSGINNDYKKYDTDVDKNDPPHPICRNCIHIMYNASLTKDEIEVFKIIVNKILTLKNKFVESIDTYINKISLYDDSRELYDIYNNIVDSMLHSVKHITRFSKKMKRKNIKYKK